MGIVIEIQRGRDTGKRWSWPLYAAALHARIRALTCLLVVATDDGIARWAEVPIATFQPGCGFRPLVLGPSHVPRVTSEGARSDPHLAVLSALVHGNSPGGIAITLAALEAVASIPDHHATLFFDLIWASLSEVSRHDLEAEMQPGKYEYKSDFARRYFGAGREEGREEGRREGRLANARANLIAVVERRLPATDEQTRARIEACTDADRLSALVVEIAVADDPIEIERLLATI